MSSLALAPSHDSQLLGREVEPPVVIGRPLLRFYPGPAVAWPAAIFFAAFFLFGYLTVGWELSRGFYQFIGVCALSMLLLAIVSTIRWTQMHLTLSLRELGVVLNGRALRFADLDTFTVANSRRYDNERNVIALNRTVTLEANGTRVRASYIAMPNDPLDSALDAIAAAMTAKHRGERGSGWSVENDTIVAGGTRIPLSMISAAGVYDDEVRIWRHGDAHHALAVPLSSRNARVLLRIASGSRTAAPPPALHAVSQEPATGIGRLLFTRRTSIFSAVFSTAIYLALALLVRIFMEKQGLPFGKETAYALGTIVLLVSIRRMLRVYRFHERGVIAAGRTLLFDDVTAIRWQETTTLINHAIYVGTSMKVKLKTRDGKPFVISLYRWRANDDDLMPMRYAISAKIANELQQQLQREGRAPWVRGVAFTTSGVEVKKNLHTFEPPLYGFLREGFFILYRERWQKPSALLPVSDENFYPGLVLFETLTRQRSASA
jgi:hypothetical protein